MKRLAVWCLCLVVALGPGCATPLTPAQQQQVDELRKVVTDGFGELRAAQVAFGKGALTPEGLQAVVESVIAKTNMANRQIRDLTDQGVPWWQILLGAIPGVAASVGGLMLANKKAAAGDAQMLANVVPVAREEATHVARIEAASTVENMAPPPPPPPPVSAPGMGMVPPGYRLVPAGAPG